jgi:hypothetical protein
VTKAAGGVAKPGQAAAAPAKAPTTPPKPVVVPPAGDQPPRSATIMGMPTIKMPAGVAPTATVPAKTTVMAVPPISGSGDMIAPAPATTTPGNPAAMRAPAKPAPAAAAPAPAAAAAPALNIASRSPMVTSNPSKKSAIVERTLAKMAAKLAEASGLEPGSPELLALLKLSTEIVERIVWEVVPELAEQIIRENLHDLTARRS